MSTNPQNQYYHIRCATIGETQHWKHASERPFSNDWAWGFFPEIGNEDEGYGWIGLVYWESFLARGEWRDRNGRCEPQPLMWCELNYPEVPFIHDTAEGAREAAIKSITKPSD